MNTMFRIIRKDGRHHRQMASISDNVGRHSNAKTDKRWASIMEKQEKIELETTSVAVKKRKEDLMILTANTLNMDAEVKATHMLFCDAILQKMGLRWALATATTSATTTLMLRYQQTTS
jgi:hypothetical protein